MVAIARPVVVADVLPKVKTRSTALIVGFTLLTAVLAQIEISFGSTSMTVAGASLGALLAGAFLGSRLGTFSIALYVLAGLFLPIYAGGESGYSYLSGENGGYLVGLVVAAFVVGKLAERHQDRSVLTAIPTMVFGSAVILTMGTLWFSHIANVDIQTAITNNVSPLLVGELIKSLIAGIALPVIWSLTNKSTEVEEVTA